eukprot:7303645-Prymnesium_polylepis.2
MAAAISGFRRGTSRCKRCLTWRPRSRALRDKTLMTSVLGDIEWTWAKRTTFGTCPASHNFIAPRTTSEQSIDTPNRTKNRYTPWEVSPNPYVLQIALPNSSASWCEILNDDRSHDLIKRTHTAQR